MYQLNREECYLQNEINFARCSKVTISDFVRKMYQML